jgi:hypothetical protein
MNLYLRLRHAFPHSAVKTAQDHYWDQPREFEKGSPPGSWVPYTAPLGGLLGMTAAEAAAYMRQPANPNTPRGATQNFQHTYSHAVPAYFGTNTAAANTLLSAQPHLQRGGIKALSPALATGKFTPDQLRILNNAVLSANTPQAYPPPQGQIQPAAIHPATTQIVNAARQSVNPANHGNLHTSIPPKPLVPPKARRGIAGTLGALAGTAAPYLSELFKD